MEGWGGGPAPKKKKNKIKKKFFNVLNGGVVRPPTNEKNKMKNKKIEGGPNHSFWSALGWFGHPFWLA
jgi:hypothetical protein